MAIIRFGENPFFKNPWVEFEKMRRDMDRLSRGISGEPGGYSLATVFPPLNISEDNEAVYVRAEMAGVKPEDVDISVEGETLSVKGTRKPLAPEDEKVSFHRRELEYGNFSRAVTLPSRVKIDRVEATINNGILTIVLPKADEVKPRQIKVDIG